MYSASKWVFRADEQAESQTASRPRLQAHGMYPGSATRVNEVYWADSIWLSAHLLMEYSPADQVVMCPPNASGNWGRALRTNYGTPKAREVFGHCHFESRRTWRNEMQHALLQAAPSGSPYSPCVALSSPFRRIAHVHGSWRRKTWLFNYRT